LGICKKLSQKDWVFPLKSYKRNRKNFKIEKNGKGN